MNKRKKEIQVLFTFLVLSILVFLSSCSKIDQYYQDYKPLSSYNMSAYQGNQILTFQATALGNDTGKGANIGITGTWNPADAGGDIYTMRLNVAPVLKGYIGSYNVYATFGGYNANIASGSSNVFYYQSGSPSVMSITAYDSINKTISGTFSFGATGGATQGGHPNLYPSPTFIGNGVFTKVPVTR